jgi:chorismate mutase
MCIRGVRGATIVKENTREAILTATREMLQRLVEANGIEVDDIASAFFSTTRDLNADYPAIAARQLGWTDTALMCMHEMDVPHGLPRVVRVMLHWNTDKRSDQIVHVYINGAEALRPDRKGD